MKRTLVVVLRAVVPLLVGMSCLGIVPRCAAQTGIGGIEGPVARPPVVPTFTPTLTPSPLSTTTLSPSLSPSLSPASPQIELRTESPRAESPREISSSEATSSVRQSESHQDDDRSGSAGGEAVVVARDESPSGNERPAAGGSPGGEGKSGDGGGGDGGAEGSGVGGSERTPHTSVPVVAFWIAVVCFVIYGTTKKKSTRA